MAEAPTPTGWVCVCCGAPGRAGTPCGRCGAQAYRTDHTAPQTTAHAATPTDRDRKEAA